MIWECVRGISGYSRRCLRGSFREVFQVYLESVLGGVTRVFEGMIKFLLCV